jgi:hypothetical protein
MARWQPDASQRLALAALELFAERGYENTTVIDIAQRAGLTKSTAAPATATPLEAVAHALDAVGRQAFTPARREFAARRRAVIAANPELQEREALKGLGLTASMTGALSRRGFPALTSSVAAELGALAWKIAYERWSDTSNGDDFSEIARRALGEVQAASALVSGTQRVTVHSPLGSGRDR